MKLTCLSYKTVQYKTVRKSKKRNDKTVQKQSQVIIVLTTRQAENCPLFNKHNEQNSDRRSRANVLRACQQRVGLKTTLRAGYPPATLNRTVLF